ncbi:hypothetical protein Scep_025632 [Stephania cephalantha]|uniref:Uncharacterized protein n=1 Tax=Stephania cephalantha TaxID=152367 RepID=A0AAP0EQW8_9MAGN
MAERERSSRGRKKKGWRKGIRREPAVGSGGSGRRLIAYEGHDGGSNEGSPAGERPAKIGLAEDRSKQKNGGQPGVDGSTRRRDDEPARAATWQEGGAARTAASRRPS